MNQDDVIKALDHARIAQGPGGPAEMVPGQHHVRMNMYIARSEGGTFKVVKNLGSHRPEGVRGRRALTPSVGSPPPPPPNSLSAARAAHIPGTGPDEAWQRPPGVRVRGARSGHF